MAANTPSIDAFKDALDKTTGNGRDLDAAHQLADAYVAAHPDDFAGLDALDLPTLVDQLTAYRANGNTDKQWLIELFIKHKFAEQNIGGTYQPQLRVH